MARPSFEHHQHDPVRILCKLAGVADLEAYLGIGPGTSSKEALVLLERKRREMERALQNPRMAHEAELFLESYGLLRDKLAKPTAPVAQFGADTPDYYTVLKVQADASYAAIERSWRKLKSRSTETDPVVAQAWRVLGDPLNRAHYDRSRRQASFQRVSEHPPAARPPPEFDGPMASDAPHAEVPGPATRDVFLDAGAPTLISVPLVVHGKGRWRGTLHADHACIRTQPERVVSVGPGNHTIAVYIDPAKVPGHKLTCSVVLSNADEQHVVAFRLRTATTPWHRRAEPYALVAFAVILVALGWVLGTTSSVVSPARQPASVGYISQLPTAAVCFSAAYAPLPAHVDVHIDGFGRPSGFAFGGVASPEAEACVRTALMHLEFPPTNDGQPAFHRYSVPSTLGVP